MTALDLHSGIWYRERMSLCKSGTVLELLTGILYGLGEDVFWHPTPVSIPLGITASAIVSIGDYRVRTRFITFLNALRLLMGVIPLEVEKIPLF